MVNGRTAAAAAVERCGGACPAAWIEASAASASAEPPRRPARVRKEDGGIRIAVDLSTKQLPAAPAGPCLAHLIPRKRAGQRPRVQVRTGSRRADCRRRREQAEPAGPTLSVA